MDSPLRGSRRGEEADPQIERWNPPAYLGGYGQRLSASPVLGQAGGGQSMNHAARHQQLAEELRRHDHAYYVAARPAVSDREYDLLYAELLALEQQFPELVTPDSPSQRVSGGLTESFTRVTHEQPMLSLEKIQASDSPTKDEEPDRERRNRLQDERTIEESLARRIDARLARNEIERADDRGQEVVEIVGDTAGELAERLQFLRLLQPF